MAAMPPLSPGMHSPMAGMGMVPPPGMNMMPPPPHMGYGMGMGMGMGMPPAGMSPHGAPRKPHCPQQDLHTSLRVYRLRSHMSRTTRS
jgi:hypothetical protein